MSPCWLTLPPLLGGGGGPAGPGLVPLPPVCVSGGLGEIPKGPIPRNHLRPARQGQGSLTHWQAEKSMSGALGGAYLNDPPPCTWRSLPLAEASPSLPLHRGWRWLVDASCCLSLVSRWVALLVRCLAPAKAPFAGGSWVWWGEGGSQRGTLWPVLVQVGPSGCWGQPEGIQCLAPGGLPCPTGAGLDGSLPFLRWAVPPPQMGWPYGAFPPLSGVFSGHP